MKDKSSVLLTVVALFVVFFLVAKLLGIEMMDGNKKWGKVCIPNARECETGLKCRKKAGDDAFRCRKPAD